MPASHTSYYILQITKSSILQKEIIAKIIMKFVWILVGLALIIDATYSVPVEPDTTEGNTEPKCITVIRVNFVRKIFVLKIFV